MKPWKIGSKRGNSDERRLTWLAVVILLLMAGLIGRLFFVQVIKHGDYLLAATNQHEFYAELEPNRGKILIQDKDGSLYPLATNKDFILIYAIPSQIKQSAEISQKLYEFFKQATVEKEVDEELKKQEEDELKGELAAVKDLPDEERIIKEQEIKNNRQILVSSQLYQDAIAKRREDLMKIKQDLILADYQKILEKKNDPYEVLEKRVEIDTAKQFHLALLSLANQSADLKIDDLEIKSGHMINRQTGHDLSVDGINYAIESHRSYSENSVASHLLGFTAFDPSERYGQFGRHGNYGLEGFFDEELFGKIGSITSEKGAGGLVIAQDSEYVDKQDGCDLVLTIDRSVQFFIDKVLRQGMEKYKADSASILVLRPKTGEIIAMSSWPDFDPNKYNEVTDTNIFNNAVVFDQYEPGSVFKAVTMATALDKKTVSPQTTYNDPGQIMIEGWPKPIKNSDFDTAGGHGQTTMIEVLEKSLNTGSIYTMKSVGAETFADYVQKFGFGEKTGIELDGESAGDISSLKAKNIKPISAATASFGQGISVTPLQMAMAYGALANGGELMKPYVVKEVRCANNQTTTSQPKVIRRVVSPETSALITGMLVNVVEKGHSKQAGVKGYYIAGKTGTAQATEAGKRGYAKNKYDHTFVGFGPDNDPQFVVLVRLNNPKGFEYAESTAVPLAHEVIEFLLNYLQIPKSRN